MMGLLLTVDQILYVKKETKLALILFLFFTKIFSFGRGLFYIVLNEVHCSVYSYVMTSVGLAAGCTG